MEAYQIINLPPLRWGANIAAICSSLRTQSDFRLAVMGDKAPALEPVWETVIAMPREWADRFKYELIGCEVFVKQQPEELPISVIGKRVHIDNVYISRFINNCLQPQRMGWYNSDFSGYGSLIFNPFDGEITVDVFKSIASAVGYTAQDVIENGAETPLTMWQKKFLIERVVPFMKEWHITFGEGHYAGRPLGMKRGIEKVRSIVLTDENPLNAIAELRGFGTVVTSVI